MVAIMVVVLISEANGLGLTAMPWIPARSFLGGRRFWVPTVPAHDTPGLQNSLGTVRPDGAQDTVPPVGEGWGVLGDSTSPSGPGPGEVAKPIGARAVAGCLGGSPAIAPSAAADRSPADDFQEPAAGGKRCFPPGSVS